MSKRIGEDLTLADVGMDDTLSADPNATALAANTSGPACIDEPEDELVVLGPHERYVETRRLGEGGMGEVLLCKDRQIGREVALKLVRSEYGGQRDIRARFLREARVQGQLEHPAIVPVYDLGRDEKGTPFFTMKRVRGETLEDVLERLRRGDPVAEREHTRHKLLAAFTRVCLAVDFAHARGVLHRDLKPANVMLGGFGEVYVLDWGLAKLVGALEDRGDGDALPPKSRISLDSSAKQTAAGAVLGTPAYMAPEQVGGDAALVDARTDVYALGAVLFEILTLDALNPADSPAAMLRRSLSGVDARASLRAPDRDVAPELEAICVRATAREPADRYASARAVADEIDAYLNGDRDLELRRELAQQHLARARGAADRALGAADTLEDRAVALREIGRAIALAPDDPAALALLVRLLTEPPELPPREVMDDVEETRVASQRKMLFSAAILYCGVGLALAALAFALGVVDLRLVALPPLAWCGAGVAAFFGGRMDRRPGSLFRYVTCAAAFAVGSTTVFHGALIVVPMLAAVNAMGNGLTTARSNRAFVLVAFTLAIVVPAALVWLGVHPVQHVFPDMHRLDIVGGALAWPRSTLLVLTLVHIAVLLMAARWGTRYRDALTAAETRNAMQSWQLRRLVPDAAVARPKSPASVV